MTQHNHPIKIKYCYANCRILFDRKLLSFYPSFTNVKSYIYLYFIFFSFIKPDITKPCVLIFKAYVCTLFLLVCRQSIKESFEQFTVLLKITVCLCVLIPLIRACITSPALWWVFIRSASMSSLWMRLVVGITSAVLGVLVLIWNMINTFISFKCWTR